MTRARFRMLAGTTFSILLFATIGWSVRYYFRAAENPQFWEIYKDLPIGGIRIAESELKSVTQNGKGTSFEQMVVHSAFIRYQADRSGEVFNKYMARIENGLWFVPPAKTWRDEFKRLNLEWSEKRAAFLKDGGHLGQLKLGRDNHNRIAIQFPDTIHAWDIGSSMTLVVTIPNKTVLQQAPVYSWAETADKVLNHAGPQIAKWGNRVMEQDGKTSAEILLDLSTNLFWYLEKTPVNMLFIDGPEVSNWEIKSVIFDKSGT